MTRDVVFPADPHSLYEAHGYSPAVRSGGLLHVSGQVGARHDGSPEVGFEAQARLAFENLEAVLRAAGCSFDDVVDVTLFVVDPEAHLEVLVPILQAHFGRPYPALTAVGVTWLAGFDVEVKVVAQLPSS
ncbi:RidA family protein [Enhygromyxa salina]|uniref:RutC family protein YjgH n=1 Tax=Enhygromyxa salina TaxID=215803 RepID=A0A2S9Y5V4_9BACT|nr:RidA family protein [Enhygromyxa salina]PRQ00474.1 RutC family protein YjgH [Enhygromyxa salina]